MALADLPQVTKELTPKELSNILAMVLKELEFVVNGRLDVKNIKADGIEARNIKAGAVVAEKIDVNELSAIAADLGHITAGLIEAVTIYSSYFATSQNKYPRVVIDPSGSFIGIYTSPTAYMEIKPGITDAPTVTGYEGGNLKYILGTAFGLPNLQSPVSLDIRAGASLSLACGSGPLENINIPSWGKLYSNNEAQTLATALNKLATAIEGAAKKGDSTGSAGGHNHGISDGTLLMVSGGGTVRWSAASGHTHAQA